MRGIARGCIKKTLTKMDKVLFYSVLPITRKEEGKETQHATIRRNT
jgi:hypothetical protein